MNVRVQGVHFHTVTSGIVCATGFWSRFCIVPTSASFSASFSVIGFSLPAAFFLSAAFTAAVFTASDFAVFDALGCVAVQGALYEFDVAFEDVHLGHDEGLVALQLGVHFGILAGVFDEIANNVKMVPVGKKEKIHELRKMKLKSHYDCKYFGYLNDLDRLNDIWSGMLIRHAYAIPLRTDSEISRGGTIPTDEPSEAALRKVRV